MTRAVRLWWVGLPVYIISGLVLGLADPMLGRCAQQLGLRPGLGTAAIVNVLAPLAVLALAVVHRRVVAAVVGAALLTLGLIGGLAFQYPQGVRDWSPIGLLASIPPVLAAACMGYAVVGTLAAVAASAFQRRGPLKYAAPSEP